MKRRIKRKAERYFLITYTDGAKNGEMSITANCFPTKEFITDFAKEQALNFKIIIITNIYEFNSKADFKFFQKTKNENNIKYNF
jgi:hypothetical protein